MTREEIDKAAREFKPNLLMVLNSDLTDFALDMVRKHNEELYKTAANQGGIISKTQILEAKP